jgi:hypothetical protein
VGYGFKDIVDLSQLIFTHMGEYSDICSKCQALRKNSVEILPDNRRNKGLNGRVDP